MCDCIDELDKQLTANNTRVSRQLRINIEQGRMVVSGSMVKTEKIDDKKRTPLINLEATYCPFCGAKYQQGN